MLRAYSPHTLQWPKQPIILYCPPSLSFLRPSISIPICIPHTRSSPTSSPTLFDAQRMNTNSLKALLWRFMEYVTSIGPPLACCSKVVNTWIVLEEQKEALLSTFWNIQAHQSPPIWRPWGEFGGCRSLFL